MDYYSDKAPQVIAKRALVKLCKDEDFLAKIKIRLIENISNNKSLDDNTKAYQIKLINDDKFLKSIMQKVVEKCETNDFITDLIKEINCGINDFINVVEDELKLV